LGKKNGAERGASTMGIEEKVCFRNFRPRKVHIRNPYTILRLLGIQERNSDKEKRTMKKKTSKKKQRGATERVIQMDGDRRLNIGEAGDVNVAHVFSA